MIAWQLVVGLLVDKKCMTFLLEEVFLHRYGTHTSTGSIAVHVCTQILHHYTPNKTTTVTLAHARRGLIMPYSSLPAPDFRCLQYIRKKWYSIVLYFIAAGRWGVEPGYACCHSPLILFPLPVGWWYTL